MTIQLDQGEEPITLPAAAKLVGASRVAVWGWITKGIDGIRLRGGRIGRMWITSKEALQEFHEALTRVRVEPKFEPPAQAEPKARSRKRSPEEERRAQEWVRRWKERTGKAGRSEA